jgi:hypothetical protein
MFHHFSKIRFTQSIVVEDNNNEKSTIIATCQSEETRKVRR